MSNAFRISTAEALQLGLIDDDPTTTTAAAQTREAGKPAGASTVRPSLVPVRASAEDLFAEQLRFHVERGLKVMRQYAFAKEALGRQWRFDFAFPDQRIAVEIDGVCVRRIGVEVVMGGRHGTITGIRGDNEKLNAATQLGWGVLRFFQSDVKPRRAIDGTLLVLATRGWRG